MYQCKLEPLTFKLRSEQDLSWILRYGSPFQVIDETGSGCICFGVEKQGVKYFLKIAGADTVSAEVSPAESIAMLQQALPLYERISHPNLIRLVSHHPFEKYYVSIFDWADGECLFDHWNFDAYEQNPSLISPADRFKSLPVSKKLKTAEVLFSFLEAVSKSGYVAVDFYDGSLIYNFPTDTTTICDIDLFRKKPARNDIGENFYGTKRLKAPEEYRLGANLDERTNVYTLGAMLFDFFGSFRPEEIAKRYQENAFSPCPSERWGLNAAGYTVLLKAVMKEPERRYQTIEAFHADWNRALSES